MLGTGHLPALLPTAEGTSPGVRPGTQLLNPSSSVELTDSGATETPPTPSPHFRELEPQSRCPCVSIFVHHPRPPPLPPPPALTLTLCPDQATPGTMLQHLETWPSPRPMLLGLSGSPEQVAKVGAGLAQANSGAYFSRRAWCWLGAHKFC